ncbi:YqzM family protein [Paenibacillus thailandensis]|uniref:YqzM family protein n=1 Tax=Paenibacillus thailandensis TaxID=393250 RepID=A0ABW5QRW4_9BACL
MENVNARDPREHVNEEPRNDLQDVVFGFGGMLLFMTVIFFAAVIVKFIIT